MKPEPDAHGPTGSCIVSFGCLLATLALGFLLGYLVRL